VLEVTGGIAAAIRLAKEFHAKPNSVNIKVVDRFSLSASSVATLSAL
jgi:hypothetical protein